VILPYILRLYILLYGMGPPCDVFPGHELLIAFAYSSPCVHLHTYTILFYSSEGDHPGPSTLQGSSSHGHRKECLHRGYPGQHWSQVSSFARASRDSFHVSASLHAVFVFVHFRFVDREGRQTVVVNVLPLPTG